MLRKLTILIIAVIFSPQLIIGQSCPIINDNGSFEEKIYVPGGEPTIGITTGQISNWNASHGTVDYVTTDWNWYGIEGITSIAAHMCYGNRETHNHSEGMYTTVEIHGDDDLIYTLSLDYGTVCESSNNGFLNIALNNNLTNDGGHNWFQYPTPEVYPEAFQEIQAVDRMELTTDVNLELSGMSKYQKSFVPNGDYQQIWMFTEYQHVQEDFINCGIIIDNVKLTATTSALKGINVESIGSNSFHLTPKYGKDLNVVSYNWTVDGNSVGSESGLTQIFTEDVYTICLDIIDDRGACGSTCTEYEVIKNEEEGQSSETACTFSACLDLGGLPNVERIELLSSAGDFITLDNSTEGFYFPYCVGTASMCAGGSTEVNLLLEDLNHYFEKYGFNAKAVTGYSPLASDVECRSMAVTIISSDLTPTRILLDDYLNEDVSLMEIVFDFDPSNCSSSIASEEDIELAFVSDEIESTGTTNKKLKPILKGKQLVIEDRDFKKGQDITEELKSEVVIYTLGGSKLTTVKNYIQGDEINVDALKSGMYVINVVNKNEKKSGFFFIGD